MAERLDGTVALVTGASSGIGAAIARRLAAEGADVALVARRRDRLEALADEVRALGRRVVVVDADLTDADEAQRAVVATLGGLDRIDTLVNSAGVMLNAPTLDGTLDEWDRMVTINLQGLLYVTRAALPHLLDAVGSSPRSVADVVNISSVAGRETRVGSAVYNATKHGVTAITDAWRKEFSSRSVRFSAIEPGAVATELVGHQQQATQDAFAERMADAEILEADDIADAAGFIVTRPRRMAVNEILIRPTDQA